MPAAIGWRAAHTSKAGPPAGGGAEGAVAHVLVGRCFAHDVSRAKGLCSDGG